MDRRAQWDLVIQIAEVKCQTSMEAFERAEFQAEPGRAWQDRLNDPVEALGCFERALGAAPELPSALHGLANLHQSAGRRAPGGSMRDPTLIQDRADQTMVQFVPRFLGPHRSTQGRPEQR